MLAPATGLDRGRGVWQQLHELLLAELHGANLLDWSRAAVDGSHVRALRGPEAGPSPWTEPVSGVRAAAHRERAFELLTRLGRPALWSAWLNWSVFHAAVASGGRQAVHDAIETLTAHSASGRLGPAFAAAGAQGSQSWTVRSTSTRYWPERGCSIAPG